MLIRKDLFSKEEIEEIKGIKTPFDDIIDLPYPKKNEKDDINIIDRAPQFAPFAALNGYEEKIDEASRYTYQKISLDENEKILLDEKINYILSLKENPPFVLISYFVKDEKKEGGKYIQIKGKIKSINSLKKFIVMQDDIIINAKDIIDITILNDDL